MTFTVTALAGSVVLRLSAPRHALPRPVEVRAAPVAHESSRTRTCPEGFHPELAGAYFTDPSMIDPATGIAVVAEMLCWSVAVHGNDLSFSISHFSGYMASTGRR